MITAWTQDCKSPEEKQQLQNSIYSAGPVLEILKNMLQRELSSLETAEISPKFYETPNWDYKQAHTNGFKSAIKMVFKIINLDQKETNDKSIRPE